MFVVTSFRILYRAGQKWSENGSTRQGAALSYYALFSIAPLLLIAIHITGAVFGEDAAKGNVHEQLQTMMGENIAKEVEKMVVNASQPADTGWTPAVSVGLLVIAALGAFLHVRGALSAIWQLEPPRGNSWLGLLWDYLLALFMVFIIAILLMFSVACSMAIPILRRMQESVLDVEFYWQWIEVGISFLFLSLLFALSYRILSGVRIPWGYVWYGAIIASILFTLGKTVLSTYLVRSGTVSMYGAAGSLVVFLMWVYYSSQILFFGAELIQARRTRHEWMNAETPNV